MFGRKYKRRIDELEVELTATKRNLATAESELAIAKHNYEVVVVAAQATKDLLEESNAKLRELNAEREHQQEIRTENARKAANARWKKR